MAESKFTKIGKRARELYEQNLKKRHDRETSFDLATELACKENGVEDRFEKVILRAAISKEFGPYYFPPGPATLELITKCMITLKRLGQWKAGEFQIGIEETFRQYHLTNEFDQGVIRKLVGRELGKRNRWSKKRRKTDKASGEPQKSDLPTAKTKSAPEQLLLSLRPQK